MAAVLLPSSATMAVMQEAVEEDIEKAKQKLQQSRLRAVDEAFIGPGEKIFRNPIHLPHLADGNLASFILKNASSKFASNLAVVDGSTGTSYTHDQISELVKRTAAGLVTLGVKPKDVVFLLSPNNPEYPVVYLAIVSLGAVAALGNPQSTEDENAQQILQIKPVLIITVPELFRKIQKWNLPITLIGDDALSNQLKSSTSVSLLSEVCKGDYTEVAPQECHPDDTCSLLFSSGTTGLFKAVQLTHRNFISSVTAYNTMEPGGSTREDDVCVAVLPLYHVFGLGIIMLASLERGACVVTMTRYSLHSMLEYIEKYKVTVATLVPPILVALVKNQEKFPKHDLSSVRILASGAATLRADTLESIQAIFPKCVIRQGYGLTESPLISFSLIANERQQRGSVGMIIPGAEIRISHLETAVSLPVMATGEVWVRGPQIMKGYLDNIEQTTAAIDSDGWLHTGDLGYVDNNNYLYIIDRLKEIIKFKGHQVSPGELEAILLRHPRIADACVVPCPDDEAGELPMAFVVKQGDTDLTELEVTSFVAQLVAPFKKVRKVEFIDSIPKSPSGKALRRLLTLMLRERSIF